MALYIYANSPELRTLIQEQITNHRKTDSGFDIPMLEQSVNLTENPVHSFGLGIHVAATVRVNVEDKETITLPTPCLLLPRSSIYKVPFRLCNSIGLIDSGYRGEVQAKVDIVKIDSIPEEHSTLLLSRGNRLFQICQHNFLPWNKIILVDSLEDLPSANDTRGSGGFGSTGGGLQLENHPRT